METENRLNGRTNLVKITASMGYLVRYTELGQRLYLVVICNYVFWPYVSVQHCGELKCVKR